MKNNDLNVSVPSLIYTFRGHKVMLDFHLSVLYGEETRTLKQAVKRNFDRFPADFMFELDRDEVHILVSQNVIASKKQLGGEMETTAAANTITPYQRSYRQFEIWAKKNKKKTDTISSVVAFAKDCGTGYPNGRPKGLKTIQTKVNGIMHTLEAAGKVLPKTRLKLDENLNQVPVLPTT